MKKKKILSEGFIAWCIFGLILLYLIQYFFWTETPYRFLHPAEEIAEIRIGIAYDRSSDKGEPLAENTARLETLAVLTPEQQDVLLERFSAIRSFRYIGEATEFRYEEKVIYIEYRNGAFELIDSWASATYGAAKLNRMLGKDAEKGFSNDSLIGLDAEEFDALLEQTLEEVNDNNPQQ